MQSNAIVDLPFGRHKIVMDVTFAAWCEVNAKILKWFHFRYFKKNKKIKSLCQKIHNYN